MPCFVMLAACGLPFFCLGGHHPYKPYETWYGFP